MSSFANAVAPAVRFRLPLWMRIYAAVFSVVWFGTLGMMIFFASGDDSAFVIMPIFMGIFGAVMISRMFRIEVRASGDELVVRNSFSTGTFHRGEIEGFRRGQLISPLHLVIFMTTRDDIHPLHVTMHTPFFGKRRSHDQLAELRTWLGE